MKINLNLNAFVAHVLFLVGSVMALSLGHALMAFAVFSMVYEIGTPGKGGR